MELIVETKRGWAEAIIDEDCGFAKFYRIAEVLTKTFGLSFTDELHDFDTVYNDFEYKDSKLTLHYNIYLGASIFPQELANATATENGHAAEIGSLLFQTLIDIDWRLFKNGNTIGQKGTEAGEIIADLENVKGARITLEKDCGNIPFTITFGIYGLLMHTHFESTNERANQYVTQSKFRINKIMDMYDMETERQDDFWQTKCNKLIDELTEIDTSRGN